MQDAKLRTALENMLYAACTQDDIVYLKSRVAGKHHDQPDLSDKNWRYVSIITGPNAQRDRINEMGYKHFASDYLEGVFRFDIETQKHIFILATVLGEKMIQTI